MNLNEWVRALHITRVVSERESCSQSYLAQPAAAEMFVFAHLQVKLTLHVRCYFPIMLIFSLFFLHQLVLFFVICNWGQAKSSIWTQEANSRQLKSAFYPPTNWHSSIPRQDKWKCAWMWSVSETTARFVAASCVSTFMCLYLCSKTDHKVHLQRTIFLFVSL